MAVVVVVERFFFSFLRRTENLGGRERKELFRENIPLKKTEVSIVDYEPLPARMKPGEVARVNKGEMKA